MEIQTFEQNISALLKNKALDSIAYRKALTIYESIIDSTAQIPHFRQQYANSDSNFALFLFGNLYKLLIKNDSEFKHNIESILLIINQTLSYLNVSTLKQSGLLKGTQTAIYQLISGAQTEDKTPLMVRLAISILSFTLINNSEIENDQETINILCSIFDYAVSSHRTNVLSKQSSKMLTHLIRNNQKVSNILSRHANMTMLGNMQASLYLNNVREVIAEFPRQLINDLGYRVCKKISTVQINSEADETYLTQTYFFLQKLTGKFSTSTLQQICKELIGNAPSSAHSESKVSFCYLQALHGAFESLVSMNEKLSNNFISSIVSILQEFITKGGKIEKQSYGILKSVMTNCIRKSLWANTQADEIDFLEIQEINLDGSQGHNFGKLICMLKSMLSDQYKNTRGTAVILTQFFNSLDCTAFNFTIELIQNIVEFKDNFGDRPFKQIIHAVFGAMGIKNICELYPMSIDGNIAEQSYEARNNLWLVYCCQKYEGEQQFDTYMAYFYPILIQIEGLLKNQQLTNIRKEAYQVLKEIYWRCLKVFCRSAKPHQNYDQLISSIKTQIPIANDSMLDHISQALENLCNSFAKVKFSTNWAGNFISMLAKNLDIQKSNSKQILRAIRSLAKIAEKQYLNRVFDKNINKLIESKEKGTLSTSENQSSNIKNIEILIAVTTGINFTDTSVVSPLRISREQLIIKLIELLIAENNIFQKKAYKYIFQAINLIGSGFRVQVIDMLSAYDHKIMPASKHYRMSILTILWKHQESNDDNLDQYFGFIKTYLPEIMIDMKEPNQRTRKQANYLFECFCNKLNSLGLMQNFIEMICAGLASDSIEMKIATLNALSAIYEKKIEIQLDFSLGILEIVLMLLYEKQHQIFKSIIQFCRRFIFSIQKSHATKILKTMLEQLFKADQASRLEYRSLFKHFLLKLVKRFTREIVEQMIPVNDRKMLSNAIKTENREKRKKKEFKLQKKAEAERLRKQKEEEESSDSDSEGQQDGMEIQQNDPLKELENTDNLLLKYDLDKENFHFEEQKLNIRENIKKARKQQNKEGDDITFTDGIMVVKEHKRPRNEKLDVNNDNQQENPISQSYVNVKKRRKLNDVHAVKESGETFRSNKAKGDVKTKDKPEPYAFIQFNSKALNKRFKKRAEKAFDSIFEKHEGGLKGIKSKIATKH